MAAVCERAYSRSDSYGGMMNVPYSPVDVEHEAQEVVSSVGRRELVCADCGYGITVRQAPDRCPMCGCGQWDFPAWRLFRGAHVHTRSSERVVP
jgi:hypothetical protein